MCGRGIGNVHNNLPSTFIMCSGFSLVVGTIRTIAKPGDSDNSPQVSSFLFFSPLLVLQGFCVEILHLLLLLLPLQPFPKLWLSFVLLELYIASVGPPRNVV